jgi:hypothetical protein
MFIEAGLQINGRWSSPRGETTQFSNPDSVCLKWLGPITKKLTIVQDNDENHLHITLKSYICHSTKVNKRPNSEIEHVPYVVVVDEAEKIDV